MARRWLIDGMNVIGSVPDGWWKDRPGAMRALVEALDSFARASGDEVVVVFDRDPGIGDKSGAVRVAVASGRGPNAADHDIVDLVQRDPDPSGISVVTSDRWLKEQVDSLGAHVVASKRFRDRLEKGPAA